MSNDNTESKENVEQKKRRILLSWFRSLSLTSQVGLILLSLSAVAFAAGILWNSTHKTINPGKARYIKLRLMEYRTISAISGLETAFPQRRQFERGICTGNSVYESDSS